MPLHAPATTSASMRAAADGSMERGLEILGVHGSAARARLDAEPQRGSAAPPRFRRRDEAVQRGLGRFIGDHGRHRRLGRRRDRGRRVERAGGAGRRGGMVGVRPEPSVEMRDVAGGHASVVGAVDLDQWRHRALEEAVGALEGERLVGAGLPDRDTVTPRAPRRAARRRRATRSSPRCRRARDGDRGAPGEARDSPSPRPRPRSGARAGARPPGRAPSRGGGRASPAPLGARAEATCARARTARGPP